MKFIDEVDIELVNQELNFHSQDNNLVIKGGCDLFTTKPIGSDRKLFKTIDKHLDQIMEDNQLSKSMERERQHSIISLFGSSASPTHNYSQLSRRGSYATLSEKERHESTSLFNNNSSTVNASVSKSFQNDFQLDNIAVEESPFGPLKNTTTRKTFAYLIAVLNSTYPDHDFSNLQPTTENFHKINTSDDLIHRFNNLMISLGKREDLLNWIWDTVNVYMEFIPSKSPSNSVSKSRTNSFTGNVAPGKMSLHNGSDSPPSHSNIPEYCQIYEFQPSDQSILEDLNYPYQTMWSNYWFIYNKKKKRVAFIYLTAINKIHYSKINGGNMSSTGGEGNLNVSSNNDNRGEADVDDEDIYIDDYMEDAFIDDDSMDNDVVGDIEI